MVGFWWEAGVASRENLALKTPKRLEALFLTVSGETLTVTVAYNNSGSCQTEEIVSSEMNVLGKFVFPGRREIHVIDTDYEHYAILRVSLQWQNKEFYVFKYFTRSLGGKCEPGFLKFRELTTDMGLYLVGRHGELQALGWSLGEAAHDGGGWRPGTHPMCSPSRSPFPQGGADLGEPPSPRGCLEPRSPGLPGPPALGGHLQLLCPNKLYSQTHSPVFPGGQGVTGELVGSTNVQQLPWSLCRERQAELRPPVAWLLSATGGKPTPLSLLGRWLTPGGGVQSRTTRAAGVSGWLPTYQVGLDTCLPPLLMKPFTRGTERRYPRRRQQFRG
ncbi:epididymal-specific lipocalin-8 [Odocoileus virginianus]|uniref:Epididymal-specific lipocalin-8 n=1 Tax=Odocoileus virginianus TaxID=9874 RepID=A0ABM4IMD6_ODOVR